MAKKYTDKTKGLIETTGEPSRRGEIYNVEPGDNAKFTSTALEIMGWERVDIRNEQLLAERILQYFQLMIDRDMKPSVTGLAMALDVSRQTLWAIRNDKPMGGKGNLPNIPRECADLVKKAYILMENQWENYMLNGKINPVAGIFLGKNHFGYQDKTEVVLDTKEEEQTEDVATIRERYGLLPEGEENDD